MIMIEVNHWTMVQLEKAIDKYNFKAKYCKREYVEIINELLDRYLEEKKNENTK